MKPKHTPGAWYLSHATSDGEIIQLRDAINGSGSNVQIDVRGENGPVNWKNARLISAAPKMFEALVKLEAEIISQGDFGDAANLSMIQACLSIVRGES